MLFVAIILDRLMNLYCLTENISMKSSFSLKELCSSRALAVRTLFVNVSLLCTISHTNVIKKMYSTEP